MAAKAGRLQIQLELEVAALRRDLAQVNTELKKQSAEWSRSLDGFKQGLKSAFTGAALVAGVAAVGAAVKKTIDDMGRIADESKKLQDTAEAFQRLEFAASQSGVAMEDVVKASGKLQTQLGQMEGGGAKKASAALKELGVSADDLKKLSASEAFKKVGGAIGEVGDKAKQAALGTAIFGKGWQSLMPLIAEGEEGMTKLGDQAKVASNEAVAAGDAFGDAMSAMQGAVTSLIAEALVPILPTLTALAESLMNTGGDAKKSSDDFSLLTETIKLLAKGFLGLIAVFRVVGALIEAAGRTIGNVVAGAVESLGILKDAAVGVFDPAKVLSGQLFEDLSKRTKAAAANFSREWGMSTDTMTADISDAFSDLSDGLDRISNAKVTVPVVAKVTDIEGPTGGTGSTDTDTEAKKKNAAATREQAKAEAELKKARQDAEAQAAELLAMQRDLDAITQQLNGATKESAEAWRLAQDDVTTHERAVAEMKKRIDDATAALTKQREEADALRESQIALTAAQMRLAGESEAAVQAYIDQAMALDAVQKKIRQNEDDADAANQKLADKQAKAQDASQMIGAGISDIFLSMTEGAEAATDAIVRLIAQLLAAIATQKVLQAMGLATAQAKGGAWLGGVQMFAQGGIVTGPTAFAFAGGRMGVMGEAGPEAIMPLKRGADGKLGVAGGGNVQVFNYGGADIKVQRDQENLRIIVDQVRQTIAGDISRGGNSVASALERAYSVRR